MPKNPPVLKSVLHLLQTNLLLLFPTLKQAEFLNYLNESIPFGALQGQG